MWARASCDPWFIDLIKIKDKATRSFPLATMPNNLDHSKSIFYYRDILDSYEDNYREATKEERPKIVDQISKDINEEAGKKGAKIAVGDVLHKVC